MNFETLAIYYADGLRRNCRSTVSRFVELIDVT